MTISWEHLPLRAAQHGAVPIYLIRGSGLLFGPSVLGLRMVGVIAGTATILLLYLIAARWWGSVAGLAAAGILALERYHATISGRAIDLPLDLFFIALAMFTFSRFLHSGDQTTASAHRARWLYATAVACALGFLCKELTALVLPAVLLTMVLLRHTRWLRRREPWIAASLFLLLISPDLYSSLSVTDAQRKELWDRHRQAAHLLGVDVEQRYENGGLYMSYRDQLSRFRSVGPNREPFYFYFGDVFDALQIPHDNGFGEFPFMNPVMGAVLWIGVAFNLARRRKDGLTVMCLTMFFVMFLPFALIQLGEPRGPFPTERQVLWYWVDRTMLPAGLLTAYALSVLVQRVVPERFTRLA